jgi:membrane protease YdiL (CAAX protease family)
VRGRCRLGQTKPTRRRGIRSFDLVVRGGQDNPARKRGIGSEEHDVVSEEELLQGPENDRPGREVVIIFAVFFEAGLAPLSLFLGWLFGHTPLQSFVWSIRDAVWGALAAMPLALLFLAMLHFPVGPLKQVKKFCDKEVVPLFAKSSWSELALVAVSAGVGEEMLFRGVVQAALCGWLKVPWGLTISSLLFGLLHPISITYMVLASFLGFYLGIVWIYNGNLLTVMVTHALYDFAALAYLIRIRQGIDFRTDSR